MPIITPDSITDAAWEGELEQTMTTLGGGDAVAKVTIGQPTWWNANQFEQETGKKWAQPADGDTYLLIRLACTLHPVENGRYKHAIFTAYLRPKSGSGNVVAHALFPSEKRAEEKHKIGASFGPDLKIAKLIDISAGGISAEIEHTNVYPVIQSFGLGESKPYWRFREHASEPLAGSQHVYLIAAADPGIDALRLTMELTANVERRRFGIFRGGTPDSANIRVTIPFSA